MWFPWWLRHGALEPFEATLFRVSDDCPDCRINTCNLVIHLSKVEQLAFPFCTIFWVSRCSCGPLWNLWNAFLLSDAMPNFRNSCLQMNCSFSVSDATWHGRQQATGMSSSCRCGLFGFWWGETYCASNSMELESRFMPIGARPDRVPGVA